MKHNRYADNRKNILCIGSSCLIDDFKKLPTDITVWSKLPTGQKCDVRQWLEVEVRKKLSKEQ